MNSGQDKDESVLPCLLARCHKTGRYWSSVVPAKGTDAFAVEWLKSVLHETGLKEVSLKALKMKVRETIQGIDIHLVEVLAEAHQANGFIEVGVREVFRTYKKG